MINLPAVKELRTNSRAAISFELPEMFRAAWWAMKEKAQTDYWCLKISRPRKPRTIGYKSQNHHFRGHCRDIMAQTGNSMTDVATALKEFAVENYGYPEDVKFGKRKPRSEADLDTVEESLLIDATHHFAANWGFYLIESEDEGENN